MKHLLAVALLALVPAALAHQAPSGWHYDPECCASYDCAPVHGAAIREVQGGYEVTIAPGTHISVPAGGPAVHVVIAHGDRRIRVSGDSDRHACVSRSSHHVYCIYVPPGGV